ncbi:MPND protein, partial [Setophaga kirtlandii]|nr:MPND protein [Setophaga kirtlandii]
KAAGAARGAVLTRRGITLRVLLRDGLLEPGRGVLSIYYLGKKFVGDLGSDGTITWQETGQVFNSPSAWATHCKRLVNPAKKSGCGWASVRYKGQKLDQYKAAWLRKHQPNVPPPEEVRPGSPPPGTPRVGGEPGASPVCPQSLASEGEEEEPPEDEEEEAAREGRVAVPEPAAPKKPEERSKKQQGKGLAEPAGTDGGSAGKRLEVKPRVPVRYCTLGTRDSARNPQTLVEVTSFAAINKFQPFNVAISSNVLLLLDFHSHLTRSEVVGYLGGRWDTNTQLLTVLRAFPCRTRLGDAEAAGAVEEEPPLRGVGAPQNPPSPLGSDWGPTTCPHPALSPGDGGSPFSRPHRGLSAAALGHPQGCSPSVPPPQTLLVEFYKGAPDLVKFQELWNQDQTYLDKLKGSLASRTPKDQSFSHVLEQIFSLLK